VKIKKLDHIAINVTDIQKSILWYVENLRAVIEYQDDTWAMLDIAGSKIALTISKQHPPHIAFTVEDIKDVDHPKYFHRDGSEYCYIKDIDDNTIELITWKKT
jgi:catechol 2,3-dioxygenase-like lactoylglutathione lyase family enzyme